MATGLYMNEHDNMVIQQPNKTKFQRDVDDAVEEQLSSIEYWGKKGECIKYKKDVLRTAEEIVRKRTGDFWHGREGWKCVWRSVEFLILFIFIPWTVVLLILT